MTLTKEYLEKRGFTLTPYVFGNLEFTTAYKAVGELEITVVFNKSNTNLKINHRQETERPIVRLLDCPTVQKFQMALQLVDIHPGTVEIETI